MTYALGPGSTPPPPRLVKGPAYAAITTNKAAPEDWPTYRHDAARSGHATTALPNGLDTSWRTELSGRMSSPVIAAGKVFVAAIDRHAVHALDAESGRQLWTFTAGARVDSPPTYYDGLLLFGSRDGWVYALRASDGVLAWQFRAAPLDRRMMAFDQLESSWPVHGSLLVENDELYSVAGRSMFLDGGLRLCRLDPRSAELLTEIVLDDHDAGG
ncbi:MAG: PQQ-binding-like beta-propeller repeat protein, partial [Pirellulales bacterium]